MQRISTLLQKLLELSAKGKKTTILDADLMLDYTRVLYADLLEIRESIVRTSILPKDEPTLDELATAYEVQERMHPVSKPAPVPPTMPQAEKPHKYTNVPITAHISINDKYLLLSSIFGNNLGAYEAALAKLSNMPDALEAERWIDGQAWAKDEVAVQLLKNIVGQHFR